MITEVKQNLLILRRFIAVVCAKRRHTCDSLFSGFIVKSCTTLEILINKSSAAKERKWKIKITQRWINVFLEEILAGLNVI